MGDFPIGFGRYQLVDRLALGGMAELFVATSPGEHGFQKKVVIKRLLPHLVKDETYNSMFIDEAKLTARLVHPKIAQTFELGRVDESLYIAMEYIDGIDVLAVLREYAAKRRRVEPQLAAWIAHEVLDALEYAHNLVGDDHKKLGVVHRDISPSNVLLSQRGDVKLVDFGIARAADPERSHKSKSGTLKGKYGYMSPEQVIEQNLDARSDVFSVGIVLAELLTGRRLFAAANELDVLLMVRDAKLHRLDKYGHDIEPGLSEIVRKALRKSVDERWASAAAFRDALSEWLFVQRHRVTSSHIAAVVHELRESVTERRNRGEDPGASTAEPHAPPRRLLSETDGLPMIMIDAGDSMPMLSMSYDGGSLPEPLDEPLSISELAAAEPRSPQAPSELSSTAAAAGSQSTRAETVGARPARSSGGESEDRHSDSPEPLYPSASSGSPALDPAGAVVAAPAGDTITAAVAAITMPEPGLQRPGDDLRAFDDLTEEPPPRSAVTPPTEEEALRKRPPTPPALIDITEPADDAGEFNVTSPLRVLFRLMTARATGLLVVAVGGIKKEIYVRDGQPEYVSSNVASELFGNYLVTKAVLSDGELAMALAMMPHYGGKLGDTLVGLGLLKPLEVFRHLTRQVRSKIIDVCTWNKGSFGWYAGRENPREAFPLDFNAFEILGAGAMAQSEDQIESWIAKHNNLRLRSSRTRRVGPERFEVTGLVQICDLLDGKRTVGSIVEGYQDRAERQRVARMLCLLESCDLARPA